MERITSKSNRMIKDTKRLMTSSKERRINSAFVLEGARLCFDVLNSVYPVKLLLMTENAAEKYSDQTKRMVSVAEQSYLITDEIAEKLSDTENTQGIFAVCQMKEGEGKIVGSKVIALDRLQDPANLGTIIRTAEALGIDTIITHHCCDLYNPKVLRATMGGVLRMNIVDTDDLEQLLDSLKTDYRIYATVVSGNCEKIIDVDFADPCICVIGNEANGVGENIRRISDIRITIPMDGKAESLNAGIAAAITMWEMLR